MTTEQTKERTKLSECGHVEVLVDAGLICYDELMNFSTGETTPACLLREIKEGKSGYLSVGKRWIQMLHCPICGEKLLTEKVGE